MADSVMQVADRPLPSMLTPTATVELPRDRPFANLAALPTTYMPPRFQNILKEQAAPAEKAKVNDLLDFGKAAAPERQGNLHDGIDSDCAVHCDETTRLFSHTT